ncbi:GntR family transcriptional regulator [Actinomadura livida]|uniref:GntR family transcriptional regulator n=1 Tax=Actinomadura livida TaxID=79909 RepID=A0A7W7MXT0_9ACTN|nr:MULTISPECIES: GntR family transcriptional regulator [Actinomadura]MBB4774214.1 DNA-binding GntR family transcriptional regulator [Actinomadura catellatispora]GGT84121.1 GntR family transcriptional regulator [Actinomadura livida]
MRRYEEVAEELVRQIQSGRWPIGGQFAPEVDLAAEFDVSRGTIRAALDIVEELGLVSRRPRRGTRVERLKPHSVFARSVHSVDDLMQYSVETNRQVLSIAEVVVDEVDARVLGCRPGQRWTKIRMLRIDPADDGWPLCCTDVYLEPDVAAAVGDQVLDPKRLISDMVEEATGRTVHTIEQRMRAATVPDAMVDMLRTTAGSPVLQMTRRYLDRAGQPFEITVSVHPADRFEYAVDLERGRG